MGRKRQPKKQPQLRHPQPEWKKKVDRDLFRYLENYYTITHQREILRELRLSGPRITASYQLREGSPAEGGETHSRTEDNLLRIERCEELIDSCRRYREHIEVMVRDLFPDPDKQTFVRRYWLTATNRTVYVRTGLVLQVLSFLTEGNVGEEPNRTFYRWREEIYKTLGDYMGYRNVEKSDLPQGQENKL